MKGSTLPQPAAARLRALDERVVALASVAATAESEVIRLRAVVHGAEGGATAVEYVEARDRFEETLSAAKAARERAERQRKLACLVREWIAALPDDARLTLAEPAAADLDLPALQAKLNGLREELRRLASLPPMPGSIDMMVRSHVANLAAGVLPTVRATSGTLEVSWPTAPGAYSCSDVNPLMLAAATDPEGISELIKTVRQAQPLTESEHAARQIDLQRAIDEASHGLARAQESAAVDYDMLLRPGQILGVRVTEAGGAEAAAA
jgi:hypothetical protein